MSDEESSEDLSLRSGQLWYVTWRQWNVNISSWVMWFHRYQTRHVRAVWSHHPQRHNYARRNDRYSMNVLTLVTLSRSQAPTFLFTTDRRNWRAFHGKLGVVYDAAVTSDVIRNSKRPGYAICLKTLELQYWATTMKKMILSDNHLYNIMLHPVLVDYYVAVIHTS